MAIDPREKMPTYLKKYAIPLTVTCSTETTGNKMVFGGYINDIHNYYTYEIEN